jgi:lipid-binding SYLF domain-containing protein
MRRFLLAAAATVLSGMPLAAHAQREEQQVVDRAALTVEDMVNNSDGRDAQEVLRHARAVLVCPQVFQAGFLIAGSGGDCVLVARDGGGGWSDPAFYGIGSGSVGFQAGLRDAEIMLMIMNDRALTAIMDNQFKLGADASITFVNLGGGVEGATTAALSADIVGFTRARGLFAGISLGGSLLSTRSAWNQAYYGRPLAARQIVVSMEASNPAADGLREVLTRYGAVQPTAQAAPPPYAQSPSYGAPPPPYGAPPGYAPAPQPLAPVQQAPLPPPSPRR